MKVNFRRWIIGSAFCGSLVVVLVGVLAFATAWNPSGNSCFAHFSDAQFPKWLGCAIAVHETLAGSLIAAAGALFGAWLAFSGLQDQIGMAQENERRNRQLDREKRIQSAANDLDLIRIARGFVKGLANEFPPLDDPQIINGAYAARLLDLHRTGELQISSNAARAPDGNGDSVTTVFGRLRSLADNIHEETKGLSGDMRAGVLRGRDNAVIRQVHALHDLAALLQSKIPGYERMLKDAAAAD
jgi:hypothetical protein